LEVPKPISVFRSTTVRFKDDRFEGPGYNRFILSLVPHNTSKKKGRNFIQPVNPIAQKNLMFWSN